MANPPGQHPLVCGLYPQPHEQFGLLWDLLLQQTETGAGRSTQHASTRTSETAPYRQSCAPKRRVDCHRGARHCGPGDLGVGAAATAAQPRALPSQYEKACVLASEFADLFLLPGSDVGTHDRQAPETESSLPVRTQRLPERPPHSMSRSDLLG